MGSGRLSGHAHEPKVDQPLVLLRGKGWFPKRFGVEEVYLIRECLNPGTGFNFSPNYSQLIGAGFVEFILEIIDDGVAVHFHGFGHL